MLVDQLTEWAQQVARGEPIPQYALIRLPERCIPSMCQLSSLWKPEVSQGEGGWGMGIEGWE